MNVEPLTSTYIRMYVTTYVCTFVMKCEGSEKNCTNVCVYVVCGSEAVPVPFPNEIEIGDANPSTEWTCWDYLCCPL